MSQTWCPIPWVFQAVRNNGDLRVCCQANGAPGQGILKNSDEQILNAASTHLEKARNAPLMKNIRQDMLNGKWHPTCQRCQKEDDAGLRSRRKYEMEQWQDHLNFVQAQEITEADGTLHLEKSPAIFYDLRFGNRCNLKCRMCGPTDSDKWYKDHYELSGNTFSDSHGKVSLEKNNHGQITTQDKSYLWYESTEFWQQLEKQMPHIKKMYIVGGEPLLIEQHYTLLEKMVSQGFSKNIIIEYNTNLTLLPEKALNLWPHFKSVEIGVSLDGIEAANDYIRNPSRWKKVEKNLQLIDNLSGSFKVWISATIQIYNVFHITEMMKWKIKQDFKRINNSRYSPILTSHVLHTPKYLNVKILPPKFKKQVSLQYENFHKWLEKYAETHHWPVEKKNLLKKNARKTLDSYLAYMNKDDWSHLLPQFHDYTQDLDRIRKESFTQTFPEFSSLFDEI